ncbi:TetR/AcrR family transcriptional regulator [Aldersonia kunmingensis]|uniref:TetR/AcrR family transcriptional regulator n=1 Tax=Aldersonia kunmingensis TaxID=408066 RepID=UPI0008340A4E|nr:TetR/AcrR family transcriptional regulator [Aldersonia kunmingensis]
MTVIEDAHSGDAPLGRAERTRALIVAATRQLFLERGYAGTTVNAITEACGISRAGFYTYFKDKREVFGYLGDSAYRDLRVVLALWDTYPEPRRRSDVRDFVRAYFDYMDRHGAFALAASFSAPDTEDFRRGNTRMQTRVAWILGQAISAGSEHSPEVVGIAALGLLDRAWHTVQTQTIAVDKDEMIAFLAETLFGMGTHPAH